MKTRTGADILELLRVAFAESGKSLKRVSIESGTPYASVHRCLAGGTDVTTTTASKMLAALGMELVIRPKKMRGK